ncbi:hypothetical protein Q5424_09320 [Conexibacter sp. JD483]|uniref:hypothetical protein n=1 Tax=unclassified Conexibacter TaxID=2627773 RepID=UPI00271CF55D|nr:MULTISPECIES: hypothetical protein [unclassified Conexibacter]MDO8187224.1 hypothetical protein [Conexibacter sp. CPCC 205706]MDO8199321.1 hypothetical protein [Conexibacter sp. CPCC 205762]MDR9369278.1 hypothetical protein [Conexibacter sp. JD483]
MPVTPSSRLGLHAPAADDRADVPGDMLRLRDQIDLVAATCGQGVLAGRPAPSVAGRLFVALDSGELFYDVGTEWRLVAVQTESPHIVGAPGEPPFYSRYVESDTSNIVRFWKSGRRVYLAGLVRASARPFVSDYFVLPVGYRPAATITRTISTADGDGFTLTISSSGWVSVPDTLPHYLTALLDGVWFDVA